MDRAVFREALFSRFQSKKGSWALNFYEKIVFIFAFLATSRKLILAKISENKVLKSAFASTSTSLSTVYIRSTVLFSLAILVGVLLIMPLSLMDPHVLVKTSLKLYIVSLV